MNIFVLDTDIKKAASYHCDKHVVKMCLEYAQLLCTTAHQVLGERVGYKPTHINHPCAIWTRKSKSNARWLTDLLIALGDEYTIRYNKVHKSVAVGYDAGMQAMVSMPDMGLTTFVQCMPPWCQDSDPVLAYRHYYMQDKAGIATWKNGQPVWWRA